MNTDTMLSSRSAEGPRMQGCGNGQSLRVAIEAEIVSGTEGGGEQFLIGLAHGIGGLTDDRSQYSIMTAGEHSDWIRPYIGSNTHIVPVPGHVSPPRHRLGRLLRAMRRPAGAARRRVRRLLKGPPPPRVWSVPCSTGFYESIEPDVIHITYPLHFFTSKVPTIYTMHDLMHRHLPELFSKDHLNMRETLYPTGFAYSEAIVTSSRWVKEDLIRQYGVPSEKIYVVPLAAPTATYRPLTEEMLVAAKKKFRLPQSFMLYPALTYASKGHIPLIEAIALLRDRDGMKLNLICPGPQKLHWPVIQKRLNELQLQSQVRFLGFIGAEDLRCLFHLTDFLALPTQFEGVGLPLLEAFSEGTAVVCSDIPAFREYGGDAPLFFNCRSTEAIAEAIRRAAADAELRAELRTRSRQREGLYSWSKCAAMYRAVYRVVTGAHLSDEHQALLSECQR